MNNPQTLLDNIFSSDNLFVVAEGMKSYAQSAKTSDDPKDWADAFHIRLFEAVQKDIEDKQYKISTIEGMDALYIFLSSILSDNISVTHYLLLMKLLGEALTEIYEKYPGRSMRSLNTISVPSVVDEIFEALKGWLPGIYDYFATNHLFILFLKVALKEGASPYIFERTNEAVPPYIVLSPPVDNHNFFIQTKLASNLYYQLAIRLYDLFDSSYHDMHEIFLTEMGIMQMMDIPFGLGVPPVDEMTESEEKEAIIDFIMVGLMAKGPYERSGPCAYIARETAISMAQTLEGAYTEYLCYLDPPDDEI